MALGFRIALGLCLLLIVVLTPYFMYTTIKSGNNDTEYKSAGTERTLAVSLKHVDDKDRPISSIRVTQSGANIIVSNKTGAVIYTGTDGDAAITSAMISAAALTDKSITITNGTYMVDNTLMFQPEVILRGHSNTIIDVTMIGAKEVLRMAPSSKISDLQFVGSIDPLPQELTQKLRAADNAVIERVSLDSIGYGFETSATVNVVIQDIICNNIRDKNEWAACIHGGGLPTDNLRVTGFSVYNSNRAVELDAKVNGAVIENGYIENVRSFTNTGDPFSLDVYSHYNEGGADNITFKNIKIINSGAPSARAATARIPFNVEDLPRNVLFDTIEVENPLSEWRINGVNVDVKNCTVINPLGNVFEIRLNSQDITIEGNTVIGLQPGKYLVYNTVQSVPWHSGISGVSITNNHVQRVEGNTSTLVISVTAENMTESNNSIT